MNINAKQIEALDFNYLDQAETYQYMVDQLARAKASTPLMTKLGTEIGAWESSMQAFDVAFRRATTAGQTKVVETLDEERDTLYTGLNGTVNNATKSPIAGQKAAATELLEPFKRYDVKTGGEYQQETMRLDQLCQDLLTNYSSQLTALGITAWVEALQSKNQEFQAAMIARTNEQAGYVKSELTQLRQQMIVAYRAVVKLGNVVFIYEGDSAYATTIDQMNAEVRHYKQIIARKGGSSGSSNSSGGTTPTPSQGGDNGGTTPDPGTGGGTTPDPGTGGGSTPDPGTGGDSGGGDDNGDDNNGPIGDAE